MKDWSDTETRQAVWQQLPVASVFKKTSSLSTAELNQNQTAASSLIALMGAAAPKEELLKSLLPAGASGTWFRLSVGLENHSYIRGYIVVFFKCQTDMSGL